MTTTHADLGSNLSGELIAAAIAVHREFGPGLNEEGYERALSVELTARGIERECQVPLPLIYKGTHLNCGYRMDMVIAKQLLVELKAVEKVHPVHEAQLITYLRLAGIKLGFLVNFAARMVRDGIMRRANSGVPAQNPRRDRPKEIALDSLSIEVIDAAIEAQHVLGSVLLRSAYEAALEHELKLRGIKVERRLPANLVYREQLISSAKEIPMVVDVRLMISCVCVKAVEPIMLARQRSLLKAAHVETGLCLNFHAESMATEIKMHQPVSQTHLRHHTAEIGRPQRSVLQKVLCGLTITRSAKPFPHEPHSPPVLKTQPAPVLAWVKVFTLCCRGDRLHPRVNFVDKHTIKLGPDKPDAQTHAGLEPKPKAESGQRIVKL